MNRDLDCAANLVAQVRASCDEITYKIKGTILAERILVLGGDGMLGHQLLQGLSKTFEVVATLRNPTSSEHPQEVFARARIVNGCDMDNPALAKQIIEDVKPDIVINAIGIVKQRNASNDVLQSIEINAALPHRLAAYSAKVGARLIHISTDCVFAGDKGFYIEDDIPDATDVYGRTKHLGEVSEPHCLTLRTSIIGLELNRKRSLIEWFLAQQGQIEGFTKAIFSGLTTTALTKVIQELLLEHPSLSGVYHVASEPISKYDLLSQFAARLALPIEITPSDSLAIDRSLNAALFAAETGISIPSWGEMLDGLAGEVAAR